MSAFTFDFDLEDDLDESFDAIPPQGSAAAPSVNKAPIPQRTSGEEASAEEIPLSVLVSPINIPFMYFIFLLPTASFPSRAY
jgi:hypothetical protein